MRLSSFSRVECITFIILNVLHTHLLSFCCLSTRFSIAQAHAAHADTVASWTNAIDDIDIQITKVRARREAADLDTSEASDVIEDECHAELRRLKKEKREIGVQVMKAIQDLTALAESSGFVVVSSSSSGETKSTEATTTTAAAAPTKEEIAAKLGVDEIVSIKAKCLLVLFRHTIYLFPHL